MEKEKISSELRFDVVSKDWVIIASGRSKRPQGFKLKKRKKLASAKKDCPFCNIETQKEPTLIYREGKEMPLDEGIPKDWTTIVIPNKYPAVSPDSDLGEEMEGKLYKKMKSVGYHELVITRDHEKQIALFNISQIKELLDAYQNRYFSLVKKEFVNYVSIFHNHGAEAGASLSHPHSQIITTPLIDSDLIRALDNAQSYYKKNKRCVYCDMNKWEMKVRKRIVFENKEFLVVCPFASKSAFQMIISPKKHLSNFERITEKEKWSLAEAFKAAFSALYYLLGDPPYNFYLHSAPCNEGRFDYYHWHWTILPKTGTWAGFEIGTRMEISVIEPEKSTDMLRKKIKLEE
jgi:UDPglucose--hexose-1-phosphate uridylyltransferase